MLFLIWREAVKVVYEDFQHKQKGHSTLRDFLMADPKSFFFTNLKAEGGHSKLRYGLGGNKSGHLCTKIVHYAGVLVTLSGVCHRKSVAS